MLQYNTSYPTGRVDGHRTTVPHDIRLRTIISRLHSVTRQRIRRTSKGKSEIVRRTNVIRRQRCTRKQTSRANRRRSTATATTKRPTGIRTTGEVRRTAAANVRPCWSTPRTTWRPNRGRSGTKKLSRRKI